MTKFLITLLVLVVPCIVAVNWFPPEISAEPFFAEPRLYDVTNNLGLENVNGTVAAIADFNNDK